MATLAFGAFCSSRLLKAAPSSVYGPRVDPRVHGLVGSPQAGEPVAANMLGTHSRLSWSRIARLPAVPTTLNAPNALDPSGPRSSLMFCAVRFGMYWSSLACHEIV